jgi:hypothetical protein
LTKVITVVVIGRGMQTAGLTFDTIGNLYYSADFRIYKVDVNTNKVTTVAGTGLNEYYGDNVPALSANIGGVYSLAIDKTFGNIYFTEYGYSSFVRKIESKTGHHFFL